MAIEVRNVSKTFRVPEHKVDTLKERVLHPLNRPTHRQHRALRDVSFDIHRGEFFGIVGRNGSGKSTLLKIMASIYLPDSGRIRMAGRMAPFIELGVGFNPELTARENTELGGVLMGLSRREAARRLDAVLDFGELRDFIDLKVKNYSSGMMVRLAFSIMVQADADIMLIDEVLAVGDAAFAQKCMDVFYARRDAGRTLVLVTHDMATIQSLCHRAMVIHDAEVQYIGEPDEAAIRYLRLNFAGANGAGSDTSSADAGAVLEARTRIVSAHLIDDSGQQISNVELGRSLNVDVTLEAVRELERPVFVIHIRNAEGLVVFGFVRTLDRVVAAGSRVRLEGELENRLVPGSYWLECWIRRERDTGETAVQPMRLIHFVVYGTTPRHGVVMLETTVEPRVEGEA